MNPNKPKILGINTGFNSIDYDGFIKASFRDPTSFMDYDAILIDTSFLAQEYGEAYPNTYQGKRMISKDESRRMEEEFLRTKMQIIDFLKQGKNVFVSMATNENCFIYTGKTEYSGTGKNARTTNIVTEFNVFSFLPIDINPTMVSGKDFNIVCQPPYSKFFQEIRDMVYYDAYFEVPKKSALLMVPNSDKAISAVFEVEQGKIIILPYPYDERFYKNKQEWNKAGKRYLKALFELNNILNSRADSYSLPLWSESIKLPNEEAEELKLKKELEKLRKLENKINKHQELIKNIKRKKILVTASDTPLEEIVKETLQEMGFVLSQTEIGRSDIIASYNGIDVVAEVKGVSKSAAEKHAAQLEKWVAQFIEEREYSPRALLIVNGYCDIPLDKRMEDVFPQQMLKYCEAREHTLITTTQLLCLYIDIKNSPDCAEERIAEMLSCVGKYQRYQDFEKYLKLAEEEEP